MAWQDVQSHYIERDDPDPPHVGSVNGALRMLEALAGRTRRYQDKLPDELCDIDFDVAEVVRELEATFPPEPEDEPAPPPRVPYCGACDTYHYHGNCPGGCMREG